MIKVLHIVNRFNLGGHVFKPLYLSKYLPPEYQTLVIGGIHTKEEESSEFLLQRENIDYIVIPEMSRSISFSEDYKAYRKIKKIIREFQPDIIHTHASKAGLLGRIAAFTVKKTITIHTFHGHVFHSYFGWFKTTVFKTIEKLLAYKTTAIIAVSELQKDDLCKKFKVVSENKTYVVPIGLDLARFHTEMDTKRIDFRQKYRIQDNEIVISIIGRLVPIKNHHLLIESFAKLKNNSPKKVKLVIVGDGDLKPELIDLSIELGLSVQNKNTIGDVIFTSWIKEVDYVYAGSEIITLSSHNEGTPVALIEAQVAKKAIVSTNAGGTSDILGKSKYHRISEKNINDFTKNLNDIVELIADDYKMNNINQEKTLAEFSYQTMVKRMDILYKKLLNS